MLKKNENVRNHRAAVSTQTPLNDVGALGRAAGRTVAIAAATGVVAAGMGAATSASAASVAAAPAVPAPAAPAAAPAAPSVAIATVNLGSSTLRIGSRGGYVKKLQRTLTSKGAYAYADGNFGSKTRNAVRKYQRSAGLYVDGIVGPKTKAKLGGSATATKASSSSRSTSRSSRSGSGIVNTAYRYLGTKYVWGGTSPAGFDCSGLTQYVYAKNGINIPRGARAQLYSGQSRTKSSAEAGDLVGRYSGSHIGIYLGGNKKIASSTYGVPTKVLPLSTMDQKFTSYR